MQLEVSSHQPLHFWRHAKDDGLLTDGSYEPWAVIGACIVQEAHSPNVITLIANVSRSASRNWELCLAIPKLLKSSKAMFKACSRDHPGFSSSSSYTLWLQVRMRSRKAPTLYLPSSQGTAIKDSARSWNRRDVWSKFLRSLRLAWCASCKDLHEYSWRLRQLYDAGIIKASRVHLRDSDGELKGIQNYSLNPAPFGQEVARHRRYPIWLKLAMR